MIIFIGLVDICICIWFYRGESDKKADMFFTEISSIPCESSSNTKNKSDRHTIPNNKKTREIDSYRSQLSSKISSVPFQNTYRKLRNYYLKSN